MTIYLDVPLQHLKKYAEQQALFLMPFHSPIDSYFLILYNTKYLHYRFASL